MSARVLVSDDDDDIRELLSIVLQRDGYEVTLVGDGATALAHATSAEFDLIMLDNHMPRMTGLEVAARLQVVRPKARVVLMSGDLDVSQCCTYFLPKPFDHTELVAVLRCALGISS